MVVGPQSPKGMVSRIIIAATFLGRSSESGRLDGAAVALEDSRRRTLGRIQVRLDSINLPNLEPFVAGNVPFAAKPVFHGRLQSIERDAMAGFEHPVGNGQRVVEDRIVGEVAHGEVVDPADGAGVGCAGRVDALNGDAPHEHESTLKDERSGGCGAA